MRTERRNFFEAKALRRTSCYLGSHLLVDAAILISAVVRRPTPNVTAIERAGHRAANFLSL